MNYQAQQDLNSVIGFVTSIMVLGFMVGMVRLFSPISNPRAGLTEGNPKPIGRFTEPSYRPKKHPPKPVVKEVTVPGGSYWECISCGKELPPGTKVLKAGKEVYCSIPCIKLPEHHSNPEEKYRLIKRTKRGSLVIIEKEGNKAVVDVTDWEDMRALTHLLDITGIEFNMYQPPKLVGKGWRVEFDFATLESVMNQMGWSPLLLEEPREHHSDITTQEAKGTCYEDAWRYVIKEEEGLLIHGSIQLLPDAPRVNHAWVRLPTGWVWEPQTKGYYTTEDFKIMSPVEESRYTGVQASIMATRTGNLGPWTYEEKVKWLERHE